jgi:uncharacterized protein YndB with AHSA1/START domain
MTPDRIEREIYIEAPVDVVWAVVTEPQHISRWFSDSVDLDLRPGGRAVLRWHESGHTAEGRVERVEPPHFFAFRWRLLEGSDVSDDTSTLVEFSLAPEGEATRLTVVESGFARLAAPDDETQRHFDEHRRGWESELRELVDYLGARSAP